MPRSGSTLFQNILAQNPKVHASATSGVLELLYAARGNFTDLNEFKAQDSEMMNKGFAGFCAAGLNGWYSAITDKPIAIDKSRGWLCYFNWLSTFVEKPKVIVCVRDLRHVLASMEKLYRKNSSRQDSNDNPSKMEFQTVSQRVTTWLNSQPVGLSMLRIYDAIQQGNFKHMYVVRYEDLVSEPEKVMEGVYKYIEEEPFQHNFSDIPQATHENDAFHDFADHVIRPKLSKAETDPVEILGQDLSDNIVNSNKWFYDYFYSPMSRFI